MHIYIYYGHLGAAEVGKGGLKRGAEAGLSSDGALATKVNS
jgi:hypothetical protein